MPVSTSGPDAYSLEQFSEGREILLNPDNGQIEKALSRVQARARTNRLSHEAATAAFLRVAQEGMSSAHAGFMDCPSGFRFGINSTVIQIARLTGSMIGCCIGRQLIMPGEKSMPLVAADPHEHPRQWLKQVMGVFWTRLDNDQIAEIEQRAVSAAMELAARQERRDNHEHGAERAAIKRKLQLQALFRSTQPVYKSELALALRRIVEELETTEDSRVTWRTFQLRWPSLATRYKRDLLGLFRQGVARRQDLYGFQVGAPKYSLSFTTWSGAQTVFAGTQIVFQVCSSRLAITEGAGHPSTVELRKALRDLAEQSSHPVTTETVGWFRVHVDDFNRLVFIDEVQSDVMEILFARIAEGNAAARMLEKELADWQVNGFSSVRHWAAAIGYRVAMHSEHSAAVIADKTKSARKWSLYYGKLIKRFGLEYRVCPGYPAPIFIGD